MAKEIILEEDDRDNDDHHHNELKEQWDPKTASQENPCLTPFEPTAQNTHVPNSCQGKKQSHHMDQFQPLPLPATKLNGSPSTNDKDIQMTPHWIDLNEEFEPLIDKICASGSNTPDISVFDLFNEPVWPTSNDLDIHNVNPSPLTNTPAKEEKIPNTHYQHDFCPQPNPHEDQTITKTSSSDTLLPYNSLANHHNYINSNSNPQTQHINNDFQLTSQCNHSVTENQIQSNYSEHSLNSLYPIEETNHHCSNYDGSLTSNNNNVECFTEISQDQNATTLRTDSHGSPLQTIDSESLRCINIKLAEVGGNVVEQVIKDVYPEQSSKLSIADQINSFLKWDEEVDQPKPAPKPIENYQREIFSHHSNVPSPEPTTASRGLKRKIKPTAKHLISQEQEEEEEDLGLPQAKRKGKFPLGGLSDAEKYRQIRLQNNLASEKCRKKKKAEEAKLKEDVLVMEQRVKEKKECVAHLQRNIERYKQLIAIAKRKSREQI